MLVITIHGFGTTGPGSTLCQEIHQLAKDSGCASYTPTYPTNNPHLAHIYLNNYVAEKSRDHNAAPIMIGFDLGGFWARHLSNLILPAELILINPDLRPWESLVPYIGMNINNATKDRFELAPNDVAAYRLYQQKTDLVGIKAQVILSEDDELFKVETTLAQLDGIGGKTVKTLTGGHSFNQNRNEVITLLKDHLFPTDEEVEKVDK